MIRTMNNTMTTALIAVLLLFSGITVQAQQVGRQSGQRPQGREQHRPPVPDSTQVAKMVGELSTELALTEEQVPVFSKLVFKHFDELKALTANKTEPKREQMETLKKRFEKEVADMLTKDQNQKFKAYMKKKFPGKRPPERR